jgi:hypothetical protein
MGPVPSAFLPNNSETCAGPRACANVRARTPGNDGNPASQRPSVLTVGSTEQRAGKIDVDGDLGPATIADDLEGLFG